MEFDISKVYTAANADELKPGDKVVVADTVNKLKDKVEENSDVGTLCTISSGDVACRFDVAVSGFRAPFCLAYLVERAPEKKWRPYKDCDELIEDFKKRYAHSLNLDDISDTSAMWHPLIWLKQKNGDRVCNATMFSDKFVFVNEVWNSLSDLLSLYTYLDGSVCGIEE